MGWDSFFFSKPTKELAILDHALSQDQLKTIWSSFFASLYLFISLLKRKTTSIDDLPNIKQKLFFWYVSHRSQFELNKSLPKLHSMTHEFKTHVVPVILNITLVLVDWSYDTILHSSIFPILIISLKKLLDHSTAFCLVTLFVSHCFYCWMWLKHLQSST